METFQHPYISLAQESIHHYLNHHEKLSCPDPLSKDLQSRCGAFVSIKKLKQLRGCIGTLEPCEPNLAMEIIENALKAALHDPRFSPVITEELRDLSYSIDIIGPLEKGLHPGGVGPSYLRPGGAQKGQTGSAVA